MLSCSSSNLPKSENDNKTLNLFDNALPIIVLKDASCSLCLKNLKKYFDDAGVQSILVYDREKDNRLKFSKYVAEWPIEYLYYYTEEVELFEHLDGFPVVVWHGRVIDYDSLFDERGNVIYNFNL